METNTNAQNGATAKTGVNQLEILSKLSSQTAVGSFPLAQFLNAPGNEKVKDFFFTPVTEKTLTGKRIAIISSDGFEEIELTGPAWYFRELGAQVDIVAPKYKPAPANFGLSMPEEMSKTHIMAIQYLLPVGWIKVDHTVDQISADDYDAIFIPGGAWNPDNLRHDPEVVQFVKDFSATGKLVAAICHATVVLINAEIIKGKKLTGYWNIQIDLKNAGGIVSDVPVVVDGNLVTSRHPIDIADFSKAVENWLIEN